VDLLTNYSESDTSCTADSEHDCWLNGAIEQCDPYQCTTDGSAGVTEPSMTHGDMAVEMRITGDSLDRADDATIQSAGWDWSNSAGLGSSCTEGGSYLNGTYSLNPVCSGGSGLPAYELDGEESQGYTTGDHIASFLHCYLDAETTNIVTATSSASGQKVVSLPNTTGLSVGQAVQDTTTGHSSYVASGTTIASISAGTSVTLSNNIVTTIPSGDNIQFGGVNSASGLDSSDAVADWHTYEIDWTSAAIHVYVDGNLIDNWTPSNTDPGCAQTGKWAPFPDIDLVAFLQEVMTFDPGSSYYSDTQTMQINWIAERAQS
jgi:hypothetical protein